MLGTRGIDGAGGVYDWGVLMTALAMIWQFEWWCW